MEAAVQEYDCVVCAQDQEDEEERVRVMSYSVGAVQVGAEECGVQDSRVLLWEGHREPRLLREIIQCDADVRVVASAILLAWKGCGVARGDTVLVDSHRVQVHGAVVVVGIHVYVHAYMCVYSV